MKLRVNCDSRENPVLIGFMVRENYRFPGKAVYEE